MTYLERQATAQERAEEQRKRIGRQKEEEMKRARLAQLRGQAKTGIDTLERVKLAKQNIWRKKWEGRMRKWDARLKQG